MLNVIRKVAFPKERSGLRFLLKLRKKRLDSFVSLAQVHGSYVGYKILQDHVLLLTDATAIQSIFQEKNADYVRSKFVRYLKYIFSGGIFLSDGDVWYKQRTEAAPVFANGNFPEMSGQMVAAMEAMFERWDAKIDLDQPIDLNLEMTWYSLDVALRTLFHLQRDDVAKDIQDNLGNLLREAETRIWALFPLPQLWVMKLPKYKNSLNMLHGIVDGIISERSQSKAYPKDLLSRAIQSYENGDTTYSVLQDKVVAYLTSAHETTANALIWALYEISQRPDVLKKIEAEAVAVLRDQKPTYETLKQLNYSRQVFDETLRLYPSVWAMSREATKDDFLPLDDGTVLAIKKGTTIMLSPYVVHRQEKYWSNPLAFDPDRFSPDEIKKRPKMSYFPFAGGARLCLGFRFAQIEGCTALAMIADRYSFSLVPGQDIHPEPNITLRPNGPVLFRVRRKTNSKDIEAVITSNIFSQDAPSQCPYHQQAIGAQ